MWHARRVLCEGHFFLEYRINHPQYATVLYVICDHGLDILAQHFLETHLTFNIGQRDTFGLTTLHTVSRWGLLRVVKLLLARDPTLVAVKDEERATPLHLAAEGGHATVVEILLERASESDY